MNRFHGIVVALLTPFDRDYRINDKALRQLVRMNLDKGVNGFYVCGSTAEAFMLDINQRKHILEVVADENAGKACIYAHVGSISGIDSVALARHAQKAGADALSAVPPFYYSFPFEDIFGYYKAIADAAELPVLIYNFPANSGVKLTVGQFREILEDKRIMGVKHTSSDYYQMERIKQIHQNVVVFNGYDETFLAGLAMGADGGIGSTFNFMAEKFVAISKLYHAGQTKEASALQYEVNNVIDALCLCGTFQAEKYALQLMGIDMGDCLPPFSKLRDDNKTYLKDVLTRNKCLI